MRYPLMGMFLGALLLASFGVLGAWDSEEAERQSQEYCEMVSKGAWPDFKGSFEEDCS